MKRIAVVTEADEKMASGHLMESIVCAQVFSRAGYDVVFYINKDAPEPLKERILFPFIEYEELMGETSDFCEKCRFWHCDCYLFNLREIDNVFLLKFKREIEDCVVICVDEWGHRKLDCDVIVNPMIDPYYWEYLDSTAQKYYGEKYLVLFPELADYHKRKKRINISIQKLLITMGGVDPHGYSLELAKWLPEHYLDCQIDFVLGGGFQKANEIKSVLGSYVHVNVYQNISFLYRLLYEADLVLCAGGNTLHEAAAIGTPALIFPSAVHENRNAEMFIKNGFGRKVDCEKVEKQEVLYLLSTLNDAAVRKEMSVAGKRMIDGAGAGRMLNIVESMLD